MKVLKLDSDIPDIAFRLAPWLPTLTFLIHFSARDPATILCFRISADKTGPYVYTSVRLLQGTQKRKAVFIPTGAHGIHLIWSRWSSLPLGIPERTHRGLRLTRPSGQHHPHPPETNMLDHFAHRFETDRDNMTIPASG